MLPLVYIELHAKTITIGKKSFTRVRCNEIFRERLIRIKSVNQRIKPSKLILSKKG